MLLVNPPDDQEPQFISRTDGNLYQILIIPQRLRFNEVDPVFLPVRQAFPRIELEIHGI